MTSALREVDGVGNDIFDFNVERVRVLNMREKKQQDMIRKKVEERVFRFEQREHSAFLEEIVSHIVHYVTSKHDRSNLVFNVRQMIYRHMPVTYKDLHEQRMKKPDVYNQKVFSLEDSIIQIIDELVEEER